MGDLVRLKTMPEQQQTLFERLAVLDKMERELEAKYLKERNWIQSERDQIHEELLALKGIELPRKRRK